MLVGIISDTHDNVKNLQKAIKIFNEKEVDLVIHCGDWCAPFVLDFIADLKCKIVSVFGNNEGDIFRFLERQNTGDFNVEFHRDCVELELGNKKTIAHHGSSEQITAALIESQKYDVVFSGHTHEAGVEKIKETLHVNPGSTCGYSRNNIDSDVTVAVYNSETNEAEIVSV
ncbi:MAG: metallophosphoesterase [Parcubacteria group bacterium]|nr:metallophosphoesterase [Parcubacteria group bacterium]